MINNYPLFFVNDTLMFIYVRPPNLLLYHLNGLRQSQPSFQREQP